MLNINNTHIHQPTHTHRKTSTNQHTHPCTHRGVLRLSQRVCLAAASLAAVLLVSACTTTETEPTVTTTTEDTALPTEPVVTTQDTAVTTQDSTTTTTEPTNEEVSQPSLGKVVQARADWSTGYFQSYIYTQLLEELGYEVSNPADKELGPSLAYLAMAQGDAHFWANSWYPLHNSWLEPETPDGSKVGDHLTIIGDLLPKSALQGFVLTKSFADKYGITHIDELNDNPEALAEYDTYDATPGNGKAEILGCPESWTCDDVIESQIAFSGWENIVQIKAGYDAMFAQAKKAVDSDEPVLIYTWSPSHYLIDLRPGDNVVWLAVEDVLDDSNPLEIEGGEGLDQTPGVLDMQPEQCPAAANADGVCKIGWEPADIRVTANSKWLAENPQAAELFCAVELSAIEVTLAILEVSDSGDESEEFVANLASNWIRDNRTEVDQWLERARNASSTPSCL